MVSNDRRIDAVRGRPIVQRYNCLPCRKRKSKCDRAEPCLSCVLRGTEEYCYTDKEMPATGAAGTSTSSSAVSASQHHSRSSSSPHYHNPPLAKQQRTSLSSSVSAAGASTNPAADNDVTVDRPRKHSKSGYASHASSSVNSSESGRTAALQSALDGMAASLNDMRKLVNTGAMRDSLSQWGPMIEFDDVEALLPPANECREIFHCYFNDLAWYGSSVKQDRFESMYNSARVHREPIPRHCVALLCSLIAFTLLLSPSGHPASHLSQKLSTDPRWQIENARQLLEAYYHPPVTLSDNNAEDDDDYIANLGSEEDILGQLQAETLFCYYNSVAGLMRKAWFSLGRAIRLAQSVDLFDESRWRIHSAQQREDRRRIAWELVQMDRWNSLFMNRAGDLTRSVAVQCPESEYDGAQARSSLAQVIAVVFHFMRHSSSMDTATRIRRALETERELTACYETMSAELRFLDLRSSFAAMDTTSLRNAAKSLTFYVSNLHLRCITMRAFLMDPEAPIDMRFASLRYARQVIETIPYIVTLSKSPYTSLPPAWNVQFLFVAATTFASVVLSKDEALDGALSQSAGQHDEQHKKHTGMQWPEEDLDWFASTLFDVIEAFDIVAHGARNGTARTCKNLLVGLCSSRDTLRKRFHERERFRLTEGLLRDRSRPSFDDSPSDEARRRERATTPLIFASDAKNGQVERMPPPLQTNEQSTSESQTVASRQVQPQSYYSTPTPPTSLLRAPSFGQSTFSATDVLASMSTPLPSASAPVDFNLFGGMDMSAGEFPFFDAQEWSRLTADLQNASNATPSNGVQVMPTSAPTGAMATGIGNRFV